MVIVTFDKNTAKNTAVEYAFEASANRIYLDTTRLTDKQISDINEITKIYENKFKELYRMVYDRTLTEKQCLKKGNRLKCEYEKKWKEIVAS